MSLEYTYLDTNGRDITNPIPEEPSYIPPVVPTPPSPGPGSEPNIPRPTFSGHVSCGLFINSSEINALDKNLETVYHCQLSLKGEVDIERPVIYIENPGTDISNINYMIIEDRWYFAHAERLTGGARWRITGNTDPLATFRGAIRQQTAIIKRNQSNYNRYLQDDKVKLNSYESVKTLLFPSGFSKTMQYYLITIGGDDE